MKGEPAYTYPNRIKILELEYVEDLGYTFTDYGSPTETGVIDSFLFLAPRPENITYTLISGVGFAVNPVWNAAYSVSTSEADALNGDKDNKIITVDDDVYVAVKLRNSGLAASENFTITAVVDENASAALSFSINKVLAYGESDNQTVFNLGKLTSGLHNILLTVTDGDVSDTIKISNLYIASDNQSDTRFTIRGQPDTGSTISANQTWIVDANGCAEETTVWLAAAAAM